MRVVLDACVLIPAALRDTLLRAAYAGIYTALWSPSILEEVHRNLLELGLRQEQVQKLLTRMESAFPDASVSDYQSMINSMKNHPKDRHVLAAAVTSAANVIVTSNPRHFPESALVSYGVQAMSPDAFLTSLYDQHPDMLTQVVIGQASVLEKPPMTVWEVLDQVAVQAPTFAQLVRQNLK